MRPVADICPRCDDLRMIVHLLFNGIPIGAGSLMQLDPPMGIATGTFEPTDHYDRDSHANIVEGKYLRLLIPFAQGPTAYSVV